MVFDRRPDEMLLDMTQNALDGLKNTIQMVTSGIQTIDEGVRSVDDALTGSRPKFGEPPAETFMGVLDMLHGTLEEAREKGSATNSVVVQNARQILTRINEAEPASKPAPAGLRTANDIFRVALRDLRGSTALIRLAGGQGSVNDLEGLSKWADDLNARLEQLKPPAAPTPALEAAQTATEAPPETETAPAKRPPSKPPRKTKRDTTPKQPPSDADIVFARAVSEELNDEKVTRWFGEFEKGKISEAQWISRLTNHCAATRETLDDVFERAGTRLAKAGNGK